MNQRIDQWVHDGRSNRLVILTPDPPDRYFIGKPYWLIRHFEADRVILVPKYLNACDASDLKPYFDPL